MVQELTETCRLLSKRAGGYEVSGGAKLEQAIVDEEESDSDEKKLDPAEVKKVTYLQSAPNPFLNI